MGCMNSKSIMTTRSMSIRQDLNNRLHKTSAAIEELLLTSHSGKNKLFASFVHTTTTTTKTISSTSEKTASTFQYSKEPEKAANPIDLTQPHHGSATFTRSRSCNIPHESELDNEDVPNSKDKKNLMGLGSRSFHTVEEFDALLKSIHSSNTETSKDHNSSCEDQSEITCLETNPKEDAQNLQVSGSLRSWVKMEDTVRENGWKRKALSKRIESLQVSTVEFPVIEGVSVKQSKHAQELDYHHQDTPKFGEYYNKNNNFIASLARTTEENGETPCEFCPELLAAFEDCMREIQEEEESILSDMENIAIEEVPVII